jgi:hypothetical protein
MNSAIEELTQFVQSKDTGLARYIQLEEKANKKAKKPKHYEKSIQEELNAFLRATMDQVRVNKALDCTRRILTIADLQDLEMFREGVWKREATRGMDYSKQRDHTAHTLNNWLLGWYFYGNATKIRTAIDDAIDKRGWNPDAEEHFSFEEYFGHVWQYTSLLHDIGYLFEGSITNMDTGNQSKQAEIGLRTTDEYFTMSFWETTGVTSTHAQADLQKLTHMPQAPQEASLSKIAIYLRSLGNLDELSKEVVGAVRASTKQKSFKLALSGDAFDLWEAHFRQFGQDDAAKRIEDLQTVFVEYVTKGMPEADIRILDHGVCSGLLQLKIATFFYNLFANFNSLPAARSRYSGGAAADRMEAREKEIAVAYDYEFWWTGIVWATASAALHNIQQRKGIIAPVAGIEARKLRLEDEPLTYLGILVDCIQDWDRYFVYESRSRSPVQGIDVNLSSVAGKVSIEVPEDIYKKMTGDLNDALIDWNDIVTIQKS